MPEATTACSSPSAAARQTPTARRPTCATSRADVASALRTLRARRGEVDPAARVIGLTAQAISERFAATARAAGIEPRLTAHSGRVGLASELTARGASTHDVMRAGNWKSVRMVAHYSAGASAERGAVARYL